jgi:hypothetical protein
MELNLWLRGLAKLSDEEEHFDERYIDEYITAQQKCLGDLTDYSRCCRNSSPGPNLVGVFQVCCLRACLLACLRACWRACLLACLLACLPACWLAGLLACLPARFLACLD